MRILTVDDSPTIREMLAKILGDAGYEVLQAEHGKEGLKVLDSNQVDLIISDVNMTVMGGLDFVTKVREIPDHMSTPVLFLTTEISEEFKEMGRAAGATGWICKPFDPAKLLNAIGRFAH